MKSLTSLIRCVLEDISTLCCTSTSRDCKTIMARVEHEGLSFVTITLPLFCRDFERSLDEGLVDPSYFNGFHRSKALPRFLGGLLDLVFDRSSGRLLDDASVDAIFSIRQITLMFKKILLPCSDERNRKAIHAYLECESEVEEWNRSVTAETFPQFDRIASLLWGSDLSDLDRKVHDLDLTPKHGPGGTAERVVANAKYRIRTWTARLEEYFPSADFIIPNYGYNEELDAVDFREPETEQPVRVVLVPKTLKTPRVIAIEPVCMQYTQQSLLEILVDRLERSDYLAGSIGFTDQTPNQDLARLGSKDGSLATLDLSEASDRVSNLLVKRLFKNYPSLAGAIQACRSERADVPGHGVISLSKFASMGSATCFPVEAMVFLTIISLAYSKWLNRQPSKEELHAFLKRVRVYGDDLIVPVEIVRSVVSELRAFGLKVNSNKSFWTGKFRESCGKDYYAGEDVSCVYVRRMLPSRRSNVSEMVSTVSLRNQLYKAGFWRSARYLDQLVERLAPFPTVLETSPVLGRHSFLGYTPEKMCKNLHRPLVKGMVIRAVARRSVLDGPAALLKFFLKRGEDPIFDRRHLERYGRPVSVDIKTRWAPAT